jgi:hypothetical protein
MNLNSKLIKLIDKVSNDQCLNFQYSIEHIMIELNKIYQLELIEQKRINRDNYHNSEPKYKMGLKMYKQN